MINRVWKYNFHVVRDEMNIKRERTIWEISKHIFSKAEKDRDFEHWRSESSNDEKDLC